MRRQHPLLHIVLLAVLVTALTALADSNTSYGTNTNYAAPDPTVVGGLENNPSYPLYPGQNMENHFLPNSETNEEGTTYTYAHQSYTYAIPQPQPPPPSTGYPPGQPGPPPQETIDPQTSYQQQYEQQQQGKKSESETPGPSPNLDGMSYRSPSIPSYIPTTSSSLPVEYSQHAHPHVMFLSDGGGAKLGLMLRTGSFRWRSPEGKEYHVNYKANPMMNYITTEPKVPSPIIPLMKEIYGPPQPYSPQEPPIYSPQEPPPPTYSPQEAVNYYQQEPSPAGPPPPSESYQEPPRKIRPLPPPPPQKVIKNHFHSHKQMKKPKFSSPSSPSHHKIHNKNRNKNPHKQQPPPPQPRRPQQQHQQQRQQPFRGRNSPQRNQKPKPMYKRNIM